MEEPKSAPNPTTQIPKPPNTAQNLPPRPPPPAQNKKRKLDNVDIQNSTYFKLRALVKDLRPSFIEVLQTPDFQNCNAAHEIRKKMKLMMDLYKQMSMETVSIAKCKNTAGGQSLPVESKDEQKPPERRQVEKQAEHPKADSFPERSRQVEKQAEHPKAESHPERLRQVEKQAEHPKADSFPERSPEEKHPSGGNNSQKKSGDGRFQGTYVVGGSPCGWNYIMYPGSKPVYYGISKQSRRAAKFAIPPYIQAGSLNSREGDK